MTICDDCGDHIAPPDVSKADVIDWLRRKSMLLGDISAETKQAIEKMADDLWGDE